jgi:hypothetical protein
MFRLVPRCVSLAALALALSLAGALNLVSFATAPHASAAAPAIDPSYANGTTVYMSGPHLNTNPNPNLLASADELYLLAYPEDSSCPPSAPALPYRLAISRSAIPASIPGSHYRSSIMIMC